MPFETRRIPKLVIIRFLGRHLPEKSASVTDDPSHTHLDEDFAIARGLSAWIHVRRRPGRAFRTLDNVNGVTHANIEAQARRATEQGQTERRNPASPEAIWLACVSVAPGHRRRKCKQGARPASTPLRW